MTKEALSQFINGDIDNILSCIKSELLKTNQYLSTLRYVKSFYVPLYESIYVLLVEIELENQFSILLKFDKNLSIYSSTYLLDEEIITIFVKQLYRKYIVGKILN